MLTTIAPADLTIPTMPAATPRAPRTAGNTKTARAAQIRAVATIRDGLKIKLEISQIAGIIATIVWLSWHYFVCRLVDRFKPDDFYTRPAFHKPSRFSTSDRNWIRPLNPSERQWGEKTKLMLTVPYFIGAVIMWILLLT